MYIFCVFFAFNMCSIYIQFIQNSYRLRQKHKISIVYENFHRLQAVILGGLSSELVSSSPVECIGKFRPLGSNSIGTKQKQKQLNRQTQTSDEAI